MHCKLEEGKRCKRAQVYPRAFCRTECEGISSHKKKESMNLTPLVPMDVEELMEQGLDNLHDSDVDNYSWMASDDVTGEKLDPKLLMEARREEITYCK